MRERLKKRDLYLERMFETRSEAWERAGLSIDVSDRAVTRARRQAIVLVPLFIAVLVLHAHYQKWFGVSRHSATNTAVTAATVVVLLALGWAVARDVGKAAGPTFFRRMDPGTAGTVGFLIRLLTVGITIIWSLHIAGVSAGSLVAGSAFTAVVLGLAAQQTLGNVFAGLVLLTARPFRVGERIRFQAGAINGSQEGIVSSLGLLYTILARGEDRIMIPNTQVLNAVVVPLREPDSVDVRVRLTAGVRPSQVQALLDHEVDVPTRSKATVLLEELDGDDVVVRVQATPERAVDGAKLADEIITALASVTDEHETVQVGRDGTRLDAGADPRAAQAERERGSAAPAATSRRV